MYSSLSVSYTVCDTLRDIFMRDIVVVRDIYGVQNFGIFSNVGI